MKPAVFGLGLILLALPSAAQADENLVAKRETCRAEARKRIAPAGKVDVEEYRRIVERRSAHVSQCMTRIVVARQEAPLPPRRVLQDAAEVAETPVVAPPERKPRRILKRAERRKVKVASIRSSKATKAARPKSKKLRRSARRYK
ncbi:hypothetical protein [Microvirga roseola]|uniref:hypothetical protein n=1 Tax=Microvirga roseola TaxID=2883126 RepID=UPI001E35A42D|nr:hypothetical protein [Microvirga roseola]